jgi:hypothetical protein
MKRYPGMEQETKEAGDKGEWGREEGGMEERKKGDRRQRNKAMEQETKESGQRRMEEGEWKKGGKGGRSNGG